MTTGQLEIRVAADTSAFAASINSAADLTNAQMKRIASYVKAANDQTAKLGATAAAQATQTTRAYDQISASAEKMGHAHAGVNRELLVLAHEMSQGNFSRFGGSMLVLAERTNALEFAMTGAGAATLGIGAALVGTLALMAKGAIDADRFAKALQLTGNYAATSQDAITRMAVAQAKATGQSIGGARGSLEAAAGSGLFGPATLAVAARAMGDYQKLTGKTAEEALSNFSRISDGAAKWADDENRSVHFLTLAQYENIKALEASGKSQDAAAQALKDYADTVESRATPAVGTLAKNWQILTEWASKAGQAIANAGRPDSLGDQMNALDRQIALMKEASTFPGKVKPFTFGAAPPGTDDNIAAALEQRRILANQQAMKSATAQAEADVAAKNASQIASAKILDQLHEELRTRTLLAREIANYRRNVAAVAGTADAVSAKQQAQDEAALRKKYAPQGEAKPIFSPDTALQAFRQMELEQQKNVALWVAGTKAAEEQLAIVGQFDRPDTAQQDFRRAELADQELVNKSLREQLTIQQTLDHEAAKSHDFNGGMSDAIKDFVKQAGDQAAFAKRIVDDFGNGMTDAFLKFATTGKLSFHDLISSMTKDILEFEIKSEIVAPLFTALQAGGGVGGILGSLFGGGSGAAVAAGTGGEFANGLPYVPYDGFHAVLHEGERVLTKQDASADRSRGAVIVDGSLHIGQVGSNVSLADVNAQIGAALGQNNARLSRQLKNGNLVAA